MIYTVDVFKGALLRTGCVEVLLPDGTVEYWFRDRIPGQKWNGMCVHEKENESKNTEELAQYMLTQRLKVEKERPWEKCAPRARR